MPRMLAAAGATGKSASWLIAKARCVTDWRLAAHCRRRGRTRLPLQSPAARDATKPPL